MTILMVADALQMGNTEGRAQQPASDRVLGREKARETGSKVTYNSAVAPPNQQFPGNREDPSTDSWMCRVVKERDTYMRISS